jgi:hypothetical protein
MAVILIIATNVVLFGGRSPDDDVGQRGKQEKHFLDYKVIKNKGRKKKEKIKKDQETDIIKKDSLTQYGETKENIELHKDARIPNKDYPK